MIITVCEIRFHADLETELDSQPTVRRMIHVVLCSDFEFQQEKRRS